MDFLDNEMNWLPSFGGSQCCYDLGCLDDFFLAVGSTIDYRRERPPWETQLVYYQNLHLNDWHYGYFGCATVASLLWLAPTGTST